MAESEDEFKMLSEERSFAILKRYQATGVVRLGMVEELKCSTDVGIWKLGGGVTCSLMFLHLKR